MKNSIFLFSLFVFFNIYAYGQDLSNDQRAELNSGVLIQSTEFLHGQTVNTISSARTSSMACDSISTLYASNNGLNGIMFDVVASSAIEIQYFYSNLTTGTGDCIVLYKTGTHVGYEGDSTAWTTLGSITITSIQDSPTLIPVPINLSMSPGDTLAFYLGRPSGAGQMKYTDGTTRGAVYASDPSISILEGSGVGYPFGFLISPRIWNGTIVYCSSTVGVDEQPGTADYISIHTNREESFFSVQVSESILKKNSALVLRLYDLNGRIVLDEPLNNDQQRFSLSPISPGVYICTLWSGEQNLQQKKLIIR